MSDVDASFKETPLVSRIKHSCRSDVKWPVPEDGLFGIMGEFHQTQVENYPNQSSPTPDQEW